jgi:hypothetical protein
MKSKYTFFTRLEANKILNEVRQLNEERALRLLKHVTDVIHRNAQCGTITFVGDRLHANEIHFKIEPICRREIVKALWRPDAKIDFFVNDADLQYIIDTLSDLGYFVYDDKDRGNTFQFTVSWT